jgi:hypothetical protein
MSAVKPRKRMTECQAIAAGVERSKVPEPWRSAMLAECASAKRYSAIRVAEAVRAQLESERIVASAIEYSAAIKRGPRGRRPII